MAQGRGGNGRLTPRVIAVGIITLSLVIVTSATTVTIFKANNVDNAGTFLKPYFEFQNAPVTGCTLPCLTVDTQTTLPNPTQGSLSSDGSSTGTWSSGSSFPIVASTTGANDVVIVYAITSAGATSITVTSVSDSQSKITWQASARLSYQSCAGASQGLTHTEWYGIASTTVISDTITVQLSGTPTNAGGEELAVSGANTAAPFDPNIATPPTNTHCPGSNVTPSVSGFTTTNANDFAFSLYGSYNSVTETVGQIGGTNANLLSTLTGTGNSVADEYLIVSATQSAQTCTFGTSATKWGILCDAIVQASGSFSLAAGAKMYLWSPQFGGTSTSIPSGALSLQLFGALPAPALDGSATGTWITGTTFSVTPLSTTGTSDVVVLSITTYKSGTTVTVTGVSDTLNKITWASTARQSFTTCSGTQETTHVEWYGTATSAITVDSITVSLSTTPTAASGIAFGVSGADTTTPFDPAPGMPANAPSDCTGTNSSPAVSGLRSIAYNDFAFALFGSYTSITETAGSIAGSTATMITTVAGTGNSNGAERLGLTGPLTSSKSCSFGTSTTYWGVICDAILPARQSVTVSYTTTNSAGTVQSTMINAATATMTALDDRISLTSSAATVPASGYVNVVVTGPSSVGVTVYWGQGSPTNFQVSYTYVT